MLPYVYRITKYDPADRDEYGRYIGGEKIASFGVTFVDIGGFTAMINLPELSWRRFENPSDIVKVGEEITAEILDVDFARERVPLSLRAVQEDPLVEFMQKLGETIRGTVTKIIPIGTLVRVEDRDDGFVGLIRNSEPSEGEVPGSVLSVGDAISVTITEVDVARCRILLARAAPPTATQQ